MVTENSKAFPNHRSEGMDLRDYFAAKAMQGYVVNTNVPVAENIARVAYEIADAMLAEKQKATK